MPESSRLSQLQLQLSHPAMPANMVAQELTEPPRVPDMYLYVSADPVTPVKEWQHSLTADLRNYNVQQFLVWIFPTPSQSVMLDLRMRDLVTYAKNVERRIYDTANSKSEYYQLQAEKVYKIHMELEEKQMMRRQILLMPEE